MKINNSWRFWSGVIVCALLVVLLYLFMAPVLAKGVAAFRIRQLTLSSARNYYTVLSACVSLTVGFSGLLLGYFYYKDKHNVDNLTASLERKRKRLDKLIELIDKYDGLVDNVIHMRFSDPRELKHLRSMISRSFEEIEIMLSLREKLLGLKDEEVLVILKVNSFVDKNEVIMHMSHEELSEEKLLAVKDDYINLIQNARRTCFDNIC